MMNKMRSCRLKAQDIPYSIANNGPNKKALGSGGNLLSPFRSTIGASGLDFRVRNENGYDPTAKPPKLNAL